MPNTILLVEDDEATRGGLSELLERAGYRVVATDGVQAGQRLLAESTPDLIITDIRLGAFNGLQLLTKRLEGPPIPAIVMTGFPDPVLQAQAAQFGARFLLKPVDPPAMLALVKDLLESDRT